MLLTRNIDNTLTLGTGDSSLNVFFFLLMHSTHVEFPGLLVAENLVLTQVVILGPMVAEENRVLIQVDMDPFGGLQLVAQENQVLTQVVILGPMVDEENLVLIQVVILGPMVAEENRVLTQVVILSELRHLLVPLSE